MSNCYKTIRGKYPYCAVEIERHSRDICFLLFHSNWTLHTTPIQLVSVLFIMVLHCPYSSLKFLIFLILACKLFLQPLNTLYTVVVQINLTGFLKTSLNTHLYRSCI